MEDDTDTDPEFGAALQRFFASNPADVGNVSVRRSAPPPMTAPVAALDGMATGAAPKRPEDMTPEELDQAVQAQLGPKSTWNRAPPPTPQGTAMLADLEAAGRKSAGLEDQPLPNVSMPVAGVPLPAPSPGVGMVQGPPKVQVGRAAHVDMPNVAVLQSQDKGPLPADHPAVAKALESARSNAKVAPDTADGDLEAALRQSADRRLVAGLTRAGGAMIGRGQGAGYDTLDEQADRPLAELQMRRQNAAQMKAKGEAASDADPTSTQSQMARALASKAVPGIEKEPWFASASYSKLSSGPLEKLLSMNAELQRERIKAQAEIDKVKAKHAGGGAGLTGGLKPHEIDQDFQKFGEAVSTVHGRSNLNRERQESLDRADRLSALVSGPGGDIANLTPQQVREAATSLASLVTNGQVSLSQIEELTPQTLASRWANVKQKFLNEPQGADAQAFLQNMLETAGRESKVIKQQIHEGQVSSIPAFAHLRKADPARYNAILQGAGLDPSQMDDSGLERKRAAAAAPAARPPAPGMVRIRDPKTGRTGWAKPTAIPPGAEVVNGP